MSENKSETEFSISEEQLRDSLSYLSSMIFDATPPAMPESISGISEVQKMVEVINEVRNALFLAKKGDFSYIIKSKGFICGSLKALQSNLNHIAWLARQIADGDLEQKMNYMGEFSSAFNSMTEKIAINFKELKDKEEYFYYRAVHDQLTGLKNRAYFDEQIDKEIVKAKENEYLLGVVIVDVDKFKVVNDTMGHRAGDLLLIEVANRLTKSTGEIDTVARIGGDEFGMLLPDYSNNKKHFIKIINRIISNVNKHYELEGSEYKISLSMGVSIFPYDGDNQSALLKNADIAMYHAKKINKTSCVFANLEGIDT